MIQNFAKLIVGSFLMPRRTIRVVLAQRFGAEEIALLVLFGYLVSEILSIIVPDARPEGGTDLNRYVVGVIGSALSFLAFAWPVYGLGRVFGGTADFQQSCTVVAWYSIIDKFVFVPLTAKVEKLLAAVKAGPMTEETALAMQGDAGIVMACGMFLLWVLASFIAELHGFVSVIAVAATTIGVMMGALLFFAAFTGG